MAAAEAQDPGMADVSPLPVHGIVCPDRRDTGRGLRVSWHHELDTVVLSIWRNDTCVATAHLARSDVPHLVNALVEGLAADAVTPRQAQQPA